MARCRNCDEVFYPYKSGHKEYCSDKCKEQDIETCYHCGFKMKHYNDTYSCPSCGNYFYGENEEPKE
jgi:predicted RNA-binding Zn-ribbon protein involved in translation (DUF1610 family)